MTDADAVRADIEATRAELAETVDALGDKLNVKARAGDKVADVRAKVADTAGRAKQAAPPPVQHALDTVGTKAAPHRGKIAAAVAVAVVAVLIWRRRGEDS